MVASFHFKKTIFLWNLTFISLGCITKACVNDSDCIVLYGNRRENCCHGVCNVGLCHNGIKLQDGCKHDSQCNGQDSCCVDGNCRKFCAEDRIWRISIIVCATVGGIVVIVLVIWVTYKLIKILCAARENTVDNIEKALLYDN